ncbi:MAG: hypothetical protein PHN52_03970 [candidate division Zixibacteria bacterium]|nr:hypothetical protein [candidate division Zixibacteria bacterium]
MWLEIIVVGFIVTVAVFWLGWSLYRSFKCRETNCRCSDSCQIAKFCDKNFTRPPTENKYKG